MATNSSYEGKKLISFIIPCYNDEEVFPLLKKSLLFLDQKLSSKYRTEFIMIDDGSRDKTWKFISNFASEYNRVRGIRFSRNFGHQIALTCGYDLASGDAVITMDSDLQDPPEISEKLIDEWEKGNDIVYAIRRKREGETFFKKTTAWLFYRMFNLVGKTMAPKDSGDFRLMSKQSVIALREMREKHRYIRGMVGWMGFKVGTVEYERQPRKAGETNYTLMRLIRLSIDAMISFSSLPLRLAYIFSALASVTVASYLVYVFVQQYVFGIQIVPGWTSLLLAISFFGFLNLLCLGFIGEYLGRIYEITKNRPLYLIKEMAQGTVRTEKKPCPNLKPNEIVQC
ncbi:glycosyltransferase family 2 protein [Bdellovibrionota bacterium]